VRRATTTGVALSAWPPSFPPGFEFPVHNERIDTPRAQTGDDSSEGRHEGTGMTIGLKYGLGFAAALLLSTEASAVGRTFVKSNGLDTNTATNCGPTTPCRTFNAALSVTSSGGEVIVLDSAGYGPAPINITQSVSIIAPDGIYAGITVPAASDGIDISGSGVSVVLKGLTITGGTSAGTNSGILMTGGPSSLIIEGCWISGLSFSQEIWIAGPIQARIVDTTVRDGHGGIGIAAGATASISRVKVFNMSSWGVFVFDEGASTAPAQSYASITDSELDNVGQTAAALWAYSYAVNSELYVDRTVITGGTNGVLASSISAGSFAYVTVTNSLVSKAAVGLQTTQASGTAEITFSNSAINANGSGVSNGAGGTLVSTGTNLFVGNGTDLAPSSTITTITTR
jgi:hypothetical protein